jgi:hypothetical protein
MKVSFDFKLTKYHLFCTSILLYLIITIYLLLNPYPFSGKFISPKLFTIQGDIDFYMKSKLAIFYNFIDLLYNIFNWYKNPFVENFFIAGPLFPLLLLLTEYSRENPILLNVLCILFGVGNILIIVNWLFEKKCHWMLIVLFILCPYYILYTFTPGTDIIFILLSFYFLISLESLKSNSLSYLTSLALAFLAALTRPNGIILFLILAIAVFQTRDLTKKKILIAVTFVSSLIFLIYYLPYAVAFLRVTFESDEKIFGMGQGYFYNSFPTQNTDIPMYLFNSIKLIFLKFLTLMGFYISQQENWMHFGARILYGVPFLIGFIAVIARGKNHEKYFCVFFMLPCLLGHSGERYIGQIMPIIYFYGCSVIVLFFRNIVRS